MKKFLKIILWIILLLILFFALFLLYMSVNNYSPDDKEPVAIYGPSQSHASIDSVVDLMIWNIGYAGLGREMDFFYDGGIKVRPEKHIYTKYESGIFSVLEAADSLDFILLQEVDLHSKRSYYSNQYENIQQLFRDKYVGMALNYNVSFVPVPYYAPMGMVKSGIVSISSVRPEASDRFAFQGNYDWPMSIFMLDRCYLLSRYPLENGHELVVINTHNSAFDDGSLRKEQLNALRSVMIKEYEQGNYVICGGDWNMNPMGYIVHDNETNDHAINVFPLIDVDFFPPQWSWAFDPVTPTNRSVRESYIHGRTDVTTVDFYLVSPNIMVEMVKTSYLGFEDSDHHPVYLRVRLM